MLFVFRRSDGIYLADSADGDLRLCPGVDWNSVFRVSDPIEYLSLAAVGPGPAGDPAAESHDLCLVEDQEVWAAGVTYFRSRTARMEESEQAGGGDFYDRVYAAERPELFFKGSRRTVVASGEAVRIRDDSRWNVPEPEMVLALNAAGNIIGYTAGNDMSSRDIEGENPLYLPQAKVYDGSCALGPAMVLTGGAIDRDMDIALAISRGGEVVFTGSTKLTELKRNPEELADYLFRNQTFPSGCFLMTGTGIVPDEPFTLAPGDEVAITVGQLPPLRNTVAEKNS